MDFLQDLCICCCAWCFCTGLWSSVHLSSISFLCHWDWINSALSFTDAFSCHLRTTVEPLLNIFSFQLLYFSTPGFLSPYGWSLFVYSLLPYFPPLISFHSVNLYIVTSLKYLVYPVSVILSSYQLLLFMSVSHTSLFLVSYNFFMWELDIFDKILKQLWILISRFLFCFLNWGISNN